MLPPNPGLIASALAGETEDLGNAQNCIASPTLVHFQRVMTGERDRLKTQSLLLAMALELNGELIADDQFPSPRAYGPRVHRDQVGNGPATLN